MGGVEGKLLMELYAKNKKELRGFGVHCKRRKGKSKEGKVFKFSVGRKRSNNLFR